MGINHGIQPTWRHVAEPNTASETGNRTQYPHIEYYSPLIMGEPGGVGFISYY